MPAKAEIAQALAKCGPEKYTLDVAGNTVTLAPGAQLDLGAVAKGYAVEQAAELLRRDKRVKTALINAGGNIKVLGSKEDGSPWKIGVQDPRNPQKVLGTLAVKDGTAIATSGDYQRYYEVDGKRYHHILDPRTGWSGLECPFCHRSDPFRLLGGLLLHPCCSYCPGRKPWTWWSRIPIWKCCMWRKTEPSTCPPA